MKVLVTGGAGFIGSAILPKLKEAGYEVAVIDNLSFGKREFIDVPDERFFKLDIRNREMVDKVITDFKPEILVHLAAIHFIPYCNQHPFEASDINIRGTMNVLDACSSVGSLK